MKGLTSLEYIEIVNFIQKYHAFGNISIDRSEYPEMGKYGYNIKYIDMCYDTRTSCIWSISFRGLSHNESFRTNDPKEVSYDTLFNWVMAYLKGEYKPTIEK